MIFLVFKFGDGLIPDKYKSTSSQNYVFIVHIYPPEPNFLFFFIKEPSFSLREKLTKPSFHKYQQSFEFFLMNWK